MNSGNFLLLFLCPVVRIIATSGSMLDAILISTINLTKKTIYKGIRSIGPFVWVSIQGFVTAFLDSLQKSFHGRTIIALWGSIHLARVVAFLFKFCPGSSASLKVLEQKLDSYSTLWDGQLRSYMFGWPKNRDQRGYDNRVSSLLLGGF